VNDPYARKRSHGEKERGLGFRGEIKEECAGDGTVKSGGKGGTSRGNQKRKCLTPSLWGGGGGTNGGEGSEGASFGRRVIWPLGLRCRF